MNIRTDSVLNKIGMSSGTALGLIIIVALVAFEILNYGTTEFALSDFLGDFNFLGIKWATLFALALCLVDFAGIARIFKSDDNKGSSTVLYLLFGAWLLCATFNAVLTWWGISIAMINHDSLGNAVVGRETLLKVVPIFIAILVWLVRILIIGTFSVAGGKLFSQQEGSFKNLRFLNRPQEGTSLDLSMTAAERHLRPAPVNAES